jgi:cobalt-zinc-cadmium efflux system protein
VLVEPRQDCHAVRADLEELLSRQYGISHLTLQVDHLPDTAVRAAVPGAWPADGQDPQPAEPGDHEHEPADEAGDRHWTDDSHSLHCEDSHGPAYRPSPDR